MRANVGISLYRYRLRVHGRNKRPKINAGIGYNKNGRQAEFGITIIDEYIDCSISIEKAAVLGLHYLYEILNLSVLLYNILSAVNSL